ncbi:MAG: uracil-DNA glycosylase, partial [Leptospirales bacterium]|nr:uracil-DNA glycosylase [Leptospirales bacterium]
ARIGRPFAYTAGRTLFKWLKSIGIEEERFRSRVNMSAVCRCFPGKNKKQSGDRLPNRQEILNCAGFMKFEFQKHRPLLVIPIGKLAIQEIMGREKFTLAEIIGDQSQCTLYGIEFDCIPLPHPSGLNAWNNMEPGKTLIRKALQKIKRHPAVKSELLGPS